jgi:hypothetical protein
LISRYDVENIDKIMNGHGDWFTAELLRLCQKADPENLQRIRMGFPDVVSLFESWYWRDAYNRPPG